MGSGYLSLPEIWIHFSRFFSTVVLISFRLCSFDKKRVSIDISIPRIEFQDFKTNHSIFSLLDNFSHIYFQPNTL